MPLALWPLGQPSLSAADGGTESAPDPLWDRVLESFSWPGDLVLDPGCVSPQLALAATRRKRRVLGLARDDATRAQLAKALLEELTAPEGRRVRILAPGEADAALARSAGTVDLVVASLDRGTVPDALPLVTWLRSLRPGGVLVVATRSEVRRGSLVDRAGEAVAALRAAGFTYLQHVVVLRAEIRDGDLSYRPGAAELTARRRALARGETRHLLVHEDLSIFTKPVSPTTKETPHGQ